MKHFGQWLASNRSRELSAGRLTKLARETRAAIGIAAHRGANELARLDDAYDPRAAVVVKAEGTAHGLLFPDSRINTVLHPDPDKARSLPGYPGLVVGHARLAQRARVHIFRSESGLVFMRLPDLWTGEEVSIGFHGRGGTSTAKDNVIREARINTRGEATLWTGDVHWPSSTLESQPGEIPGTLAAREYLRRLAIGALVVDGLNSGFGFDLATEELDRLSRNWQIYLGERVTDSIGDSYLNSHVAEANSSSPPSGRE